MLPVPRLKVISKGKAQKDAKNFSIAAFAVSRSSPTKNLTTGLARVARAHVPISRMKII